MTNQIDYQKVTELVHSADRFISDDQAVHHIITKGLADYVTYVDIGIQKYLSEELGKLYPEVAFMGEEEGKNSLDESRACWILDPIDGTTNLIHDFHHSAISLGLWSEGKIIFGVIYNPYAHETFTAELGRGAFLNGTPIHVSSIGTLPEALITFGTAPYDKSLGPRNFAILADLFTECQDLRRLGSAAIDLANVACGRTEAFFEATLKPWDYAAGSLLVTEAGGRITTWTGEDISCAHGCPVLASNDLMHEIVQTRLLRH